MRVAQGADASGRTPMRKKTRVGYGCCDVGNSREKNNGEGRAPDFRGLLAVFQATSFCAGDPFEVMFSNGPLRLYFDRAHLPSESSVT